MTQRGRWTQGVLSGLLVVSGSILLVSAFVDYGGSWWRVIGFSAFVLFGLRNLIEAIRDGRRARENEPTAKP